MGKPSSDIVLQHSLQTDNIHTNYLQIIQSLLQEKTQLQEALCQANKQLAHETKAKNNVKQENTKLQKENTTLKINNSNLLTENQQLKSTQHLTIHQLFMGDNVHTKNIQPPYIQHNTL